MSVGRSKARILALWLVSPILLGALVASVGVFSGPPPLMRIVRRLFLRMRVC